MANKEPPIVKVSVLASSSAGNATLVATERTRLLIDAGLSRKETFERLHAVGVAPESLTAILITHEHTDHVSGLCAIARKLDIPVYISRLTAPAVAWGEFTPELELFQAGSAFVVGDIDVTSFTIPHDAADPVGFSFRAEGIKISIATDLGYLPESVRFQLRNSDVLLLESNHDLEMAGRFRPVPVVGEAARDGAHGAPLERRRVRIPARRSGRAPVHSDPGAFERAQ